MNTLVLRGAAAALIGLLVAACAPEPAPESATAAPTQTGPLPALQASGETLTVEELRARLAKVSPNLATAQIAAADAPGLFEIQSAGHYGYITADGRYLIDGDLFDLVEGESLTENKRKNDRVTKLASFGDDNFIVFEPENKAADYEVTVFTDIDCGYCRKLHREIDDYLAKGIAVRYAFYPRSGPGTDSFRKAEAVWCADDRKSALTKAKQTGVADGDSSCDNPVQAEWELGGELGLRGTPMIVLPDGEVVNGYVPAGPLSERLKQLGRG